MGTKNIVYSFIIFSLFFFWYLPNFAQESWTPTSTGANVPSPRERHTAVWTGNEMIIWGGYYLNNVFLNTGGKYNLYTNSWIPTSTSNVPAGRSDHTAVWTGSKMIIWGGYANLNILNTGGIYDPVTDNWVSTSLTNVPNVREFHTAIWTGSKMIVWGGFGSGNDLNSGGIYDPATDSWIATSTNNAPAPRDLHTAVWTGSKMIIWGGFQENGYIRFNTGGIFDPVANSWIPTSTINAPEARYLHTAVWTGNKMIVWGGWGNGYLNTGGSYDPSNDTWTLISTLNAPTARDEHKAVWTGSKMIVWGGIDNINLANTGGIYDPATDSWTATTTTNAPAPREFYTAVWASTKMIVWGGLDGGLCNTGGCYSNPSVIGIEIKSKNIPSEFALYQNYPNPFNPSTTIKLDIPPFTKGLPVQAGGQGGFVTLKIYDILGREVATLVNERLKPGTYEVHWDASNYSSGVYFYRLVAGSFSETNKMILLK